MIDDAPDAGGESKPLTDGGEPLSRIELATLNELIEVLSAHPRGLRRWSVMRSIRASRIKRARDIPHKFEDDVERMFRRHCDGAEMRLATRGATLFYRPKETAGEVWALAPTAAVSPPATAPHPLSPKPT
jgi:hypothetical protein